MINQLLQYIHYDLKIKFTWKSTASVFLTREICTTVFLFSVPFFCSPSKTSCCRPASDGEAFDAINSKISSATAHAQYLEVWLKWSRSRRERNYSCSLKRSSFACAYIDFFTLAVKYSYTIFIKNVWLEEKAG